MKNIMVLLAIFFGCTKPKSNIKIVKKYFISLFVFCNS
jgi:hypothetical protein